MRIVLDYTEDEIKKVSGNYIKEFDCYEVEIIHNDKLADTHYRIELADGDYINITIRELKVLKKLLNNDIVTKLLQLDMEVK